MFFSIWCSSIKERTRNKDKLKFKKCRKPLINSGKIQFHHTELWNKAVEFVIPWICQHKAIHSAFNILYTSFPSKAETHASDASQMAVRSWPPSRARTIRPPANPISCFVRYPKPVTGKQEMQEKGKGCQWNQTPGKGSKNYKKELHHIKINHKGSARTKHII